MIAAYGTTLAAIAALISAMAAAFGALLGLRNRKSIQEVHVIVNSKMTEALARVTSLEGKLGLAPGDPIPTAPIIAAKTPPAPEP